MKVKVNPVSGALGRALYMERSFGAALVPKPSHVPLAVVRAVDVPRLKPWIRHCSIRMRRGQRTQL